LLNKTKKKYGEVKPFSLSGVAAGEAQLALRALQFFGTGYSRDKNWVPSQMVSTAGGQLFVFVNLKGLVLYSDQIDLLQDMLAISTVALAKKYLTQNVLRLAIGRISVALAGFAGSQQTQVNGRVSLAASLRIG
jgi:hypothetical protein